MHFHSLAAFLIALSSLTARSFGSHASPRVPAPIVVPPSQDYDGIDGLWSSWVIQIGSPIQTLKVFISTAAYQTSVVLPEGCISSDPPNCETIRGGLPHLFHSNESSTWDKNLANLSSDIYSLSVGTSLGYSGRARLGFDQVALGWPGAGGPSLDNQTVAGFVSKDSFLGYFGLSPRASNFTSMVNPIPSYLQNLRSRSVIPSLSWAYTAGNQYRFNHALGSLILGGFDQKKFVKNNLTWPFSEDIRDLTVQIESITISENSITSPLLPNAIPAFLDSSFPYIWLPLESCVLFEKAFGLTWDNATELYLVNNSLHDALLSRNSTLVFTVGNLSGEKVNLTFPYSAFDLTASPPLVPSSTRFFPLKRATNSTQYTLGRTFFQEAYVIADYERGNFSVSQCKWEAGTNGEIVPILSPSTTSISSNGNASSSSNNSSILREIIGGAIGGTVVLGIFVVLLYLFCFKHHHNASASKESEPRRPDAGDHLYHKPELDNQELRPMQEMEENFKNQWVVETDASEARIFELPAAVDLAAELRDNDDAAEMAVLPPEICSTGTDADSSPRLPRVASDPIGTTGGSPPTAEAVSSLALIPFGDLPKSLSAGRARPPEKD